MHYQKSISLIIVISPILFIIINTFFNDDIVNPFSYLISSTGFVSLSLLLTVIFIPIFDAVKQFLNRRILGLSAFFYTSIPLLIYIVDNNIYFKYLISDILNLLYIQIGYVAFLLFLPLVFTSTAAAMAILKVNWFKIHRLIYFIIALSFIHYYLTIKADYFIFTFYLILSLLILLLKKKVSRYE